MTVEQLEKIEWLNRAFRAGQKASALLAVQSQNHRLIKKYGINDERMLIESRVIDNAIDEMIDMRLEISRAISSIEDLELVAILNYRYLAYKNMQDIADLMHYDKSTVQRKHKKAIEKLLLKSTPCMV